MSAVLKLDEIHTWYYANKEDLQIHDQDSAIGHDIVVDSVLVSQSGLTTKYIYQTSLTIVEDDNGENNQEGTSQ